MKRIAESTVRRLSLYLSFLEGIERQGLKTISSDELAQLGGTTSAQVRKDLSLFGSFGKRGLGYSVPELSEKLRQILGLGKQWRVCIIGAGKIGAALARYRGFAERGFNVIAVYDSDEAKIGKKWETLTVRPISELERFKQQRPGLYSQMRTRLMTVPKIEPPSAQQIQARCGHATIKETMDTYGHLFPGHDDELVRTLESFRPVEGKVIEL